MIKKILVVLAVLLGVSVGYYYGSISSKVGIQPSVENVESVSDQQQKLPSCDLGRCPDYQSADIDGDSLAESIVYQPVGMTKGAGSVWVLKNDEVVFKSDVRAMLDFKIRDDPDTRDYGLRLFLWMSLTSQA